jgi:hypothetical protein
MEARNKGKVQHCREPGRHGRSEAGNQIIRVSQA